MAWPMRYATVHTASGVQGQSFCPADCGTRRPGIIDYMSLSGIVPEFAGIELPCEVQDIQLQDQALHADIRRRLDLQQLRDHGTSSCRELGWTSAGLWSTEYCCRWCPQQGVAGGARWMLACTSCLALFSLQITVGLICERTSREREALADRARPGAVSEAIAAAWQAAAGTIYRIRAHSTSEVLFSRLERDFERLNLCVPVGNCV